MKNLFKKLSTRIVVGAVALVAALGIGIYAFAAPSGPITPATGGSAISIDTTSAGGTGAYTLLSGPTITEATSSEWLTGRTIILNAPAGFEFNPSATISLNKSPVPSTLLVGFPIGVSATQISIVISNTSDQPTSLTFSGIEVRPTGTVVSGSPSHITITGTAGLSGNAGQLMTVPGAVTKLAFTSEPNATTTYGSTFATSPVVKTQDQFGNNSTSGLASSRTVTLSLTSGTGAIVGTATANIGTSAGNGTVTFSGIKIDDVGTGKVFTADALTLVSAVSSSFEIVPKNISATITADNKIYDGGTSATISAASVASQIEFSDTLGVDTTGYSATFATSSVGNAITVSVNGLVLTGATSKYSLSAVSTGTANITKKTVTVTPDSAQTKVYGATNPTLTYTTSGLIGGDVATGTLSRATGENIGTYLISLGSVTSGANYDTVLAAAPVTFEITTRPITVTATTNSKEYDGNASALALPAITSGSLAFSDTANFIQTYSSVNFGSGITLTPSGSVSDGNSGNNYAVTFVASSTGSITKKALTLTGVSALNKSYDGNAVAVLTGTAALNGIISPDVVSIVGSPVGTFATSSVGTSTVTITGYSLGGASAGNYTLTTPTVTAAITPRVITVTPDSGQTKVYGAVNPTYTYTNTPLIGTDSLSGALSRLTGENVGGYAMTLGTLSASPNYSVVLHTTPIIFFVTAKPITVTASSTQSKIYGEADPVFAYSVSPALVGTDAFTGALSRVSGETVGTYAIATGTLSAGSNYAMTFVPNNFTIIKATPTITWGTPAQIIYGTLLSPTQLNALASVPGTYVYTPASSTLLNAGNGQILSVAFTPSDTTNYNGAAATTSINVAKATPVVTWATPAPIAAGTALSASQLNASASVPGSFAYTPTSGYTGFTTVGTQTLSTNFTPTDSANYNSVASTTVTLTIVPAAIRQFTLATTTSDVTVPSVVTVTGKDQYGNIVTNDSSTVVSFTPVNATSISDFFKTLVSGVTTTSVTKSTAGFAQINAYVNGNGAVTPNAATLTFTDASDRTAPLVSSISTNKASYEATNDATITVTVTEDNTANTVTVNGNTATETTSTSGIWTVTFAKGTSVGTFSLTVVATDISGNATTRESSYNVVPNPVTAVVPTVTLSGAALQSAYSATQAATRFPSGVVVTTTNAASITVNGAPVSASTTITVANFSSATSLGARVYNVVVTSSTGATASLLISYQVNADTVIPVIPTVALVASAIAPTYTVAQATTRFASGAQFSTTNAASVTVNGSSVTPAATITAATFASSTSVGARTYNVVVTSSTGHTAEITVSYQVTPDPVIAVVPTISLNGAAIQSAYTATEAATRFASGLQFTTTNAASVTVNGASVTASTTITAATLASSTTLGVHTYNIVVTSSTGNTANITVSYQVNADAPVQGNGTLGVTGIATVNSTMIADNTFTNGGSWTFYITVPTTETNLALKFGDWVSGSNSIATAGNMRFYSAQSSNATSSTSALSVAAANAYGSTLTLTGDLDTAVAGRQVAVTVDLRVPTTTAGGSYSTNYGVLSN